MSVLTKPGLKLGLKHDCIYLTNCKDELALYPAALQAGIKFLQGTDLFALPLGRHEIDGDIIYAVVSEYETQPKTERRPEAHRIYLDIQYIVSGEECIGWSPLSAACEVAEDRLAERDAIFHKGIAAETEMILSSGMFAVYFPWDVHRPNCQTREQAGKVRKVVVKIAMAALRS